MTVHRKTPMPKTAIKKTVQGAYGSTKTKTYQKPLIGKTTTAGRNLTKKRALASALKKKLPYVGTALTALSIGKKIVKIVKAKKAMVPMKGSKNYKAPKVSTKKKSNLRNTAGTKLTKAEYRGHDYGID